MDRRCTLWHPSGIFATADILAQLRRYQSADIGYITDRPGLPAHLSQAAGLPDVHHTTAENRVMPRFDGVRVRYQ